MNKNIFILFSVFLFSANAQAVSVHPQAFTFDGQLTDIGNAPVTDSNVVLNVKIYDPSGSACLLYEEQQTVNLSSTNGHFSLAVGSAVGDGKRQIPNDPGLDMKTIFNNSGSQVRAAGSNCGTGYTPTANDKRMLVVTVVSVGGTVFNNVLSAQPIQSVPFAMTADNVQGKEASDLIQVNAASNLTQANAQTVFTDYAKLVSLLAGTSPMYMTKAANQGASLPSYAGVDPASAAAGQIWYDSTTNQVKYHNGTASQVVGGGSGVSSLSVNAPITITGTGTNPVLNVSDATTTTTGVVKLAADGGTAASTVVQASDARLSNSRAPSGAAGGDLSGTYPNPTISKIQGVAVSGVAPGTNQVLKYSGTQYQPNFLSLGDIRSAVNSANSVFPASPCNVSQTLKWDSPSDSFSCVNIGIAWSQVSSGRPTTLAGYGITDAIAAGSLGTAAALNVGTGNNNVVQLDASGRLPAVDGSQLTNLPPGGGFTNSTASISPTAADNGKIFALGNTAAAVNVNLPSASANPGLQYQFVRKGTKRVSILPNGGDSINGTSGKILFSQYSTLSVVSDGSQWLVLNQMGYIINYALGILGVLDPVFDGDGIVVKNSIAGGSSTDTVWAAKVDSNGKLVVTGNSYNSVTAMDEIYVARLNADGTYDTSFGGGDGIYTYASVNYGYPYDLAIDGSNNIYVTGYIYDGTTYSDILVLKINNSGVADNTFSADGAAQFDSTAFGGPANGHDYGYAISVDASGKAVVAGQYLKDNVNWYYDLFVMRLNLDGTIDTSFGSPNGYVTHNNAAGTENEYVNEMALDVSGNIYVCGSAYNGSNEDMIIWKFTASGALDGAFAGDGTFNHHNAAWGNGSDLCNAIRFDSSGNVVAAGRSYSGVNDDIAIWRITSSGTLDTSFSGDGFATHPGASNSMDMVEDLEIDGSGNILITGSTWMSMANSDDMFLIRFTSSGNLDTTFGQGQGYVTHHNAAGGNSMDNAKAICISSGVFVVGHSQGPSNQDMVIWKYE